MENDVPPLVKEDFHEPPHNATFTTTKTDIYLESMEIKTEPYSYPSSRHSDQNDCDTALSLALLSSAGPPCNNPFKGQKFHKCNICGRRYWNHDEHMLTHQMERPFKCVLCPKTFKTKAYLNGHQRLHRNKLTRKFECEKCGAVFSSKSQLKRHITIHSTERLFQCDQCGKSFRLLRYLRYHESSHKISAKVKSPLTKCNICGRGCHDIVSHMKEHSGERQFICEHCHNAFKSKHNLASHMAIHINAREFKCQLCPRMFNFKTQLNRHIQSHSSYLPFVCDICGAAFKYNNSLRVHMRSHTGERPYQCDRCEKSFATSVSLRLHIRVHTGEKPYKCDICGRGFTDGSTMKIHKRVHTGEHPYICHLCGKSTKQASNLKSHYKHFHKIYDITGKTIRKNARIFAKYKSELMYPTDLLEILNRAAAAGFDMDDNKPKNNNEISTLKASTQSSIIANDNALDDGDDRDRENSHDSIPFRYLCKTEIKQNEEDVQPKTETNVKCPPSINIIDVPQIYPPVQLKEEENVKDIPPIVPALKEDLSISSESTPVFLISEVTEDHPSNHRNEDIKPAAKTTEVCVKKKKPSKVAATSRHPKIEEIMINERTDEIYTENHMKTVKSENEDDFSWFNMSDNVIQYSLETFQQRPSQLKVNAIRKIHETIKKETEQRDVTDELDSTLMEPIAKKAIVTTKGMKFQKCSICDRRYMNHDEHMRTHTHEKPFECDICHKTFKVKDYLKLHRKLHTEQKDVICDQCGAAFFHTHDLKRHMKRHSDDRPHECPTCGKAFKEPWSLKNHIRTHSGEKPYKCQMCDKCFSSKMGIKLHLRTHTGEKPYKCEFCESRFGDGSTYRQHIRTHTGERPYKCHICGKGTTQAGNLKSHLKHYHKLIVKNVNMTSTKYL